MEGIEKEQNFSKNTGKKEKSIYFPTLKNDVI